MCTFTLVTRPDGTQTITCDQADPIIEISDQMLEQANPAFLSLGDGIVTLHFDNGDVTYGLREHDDLSETWLGVAPGAHAREG